MKVILLQDVKGTGKKGETIEVSDGHGKNFLVPRKMAVEATKSNMAELDNKKKAENAKKQKELEDAQALAKKLEEQTIKVEVKVGENGKLFGSVTNKEIAEALEKQTGMQIEKKKIILVDTIKTIGVKTVDVKIHTAVIAKLKVEIS